MYWKTSKELLANVVQEIVSEYDQEIPQSQTADNPMAPRGRAAQPSRDTMKTKKNRLETPFKGDDVNALIKTPNCENLVLYFSEKVQKIAVFAMFFVFSDQTIA